MRHMMDSIYLRQRRSHRNQSQVRGVAARAIWSRFASPRAELVGSPSLARPNLFGGD
jgi:hypothetical protein